MPPIKREALERPIQLRQAECILNEFFHDRVAYPDNEFYMRMGICKVLADEFHPLVRLAQFLCGVRSINLLAQSNPGPDAKITFWWRQVATVQITRADEDYNSALEREQILSKGGLLLHQQWKRDKVTKRVVSIDRGVFEPSADVQVRVKRILEAIASKERKYYSGTDILLIHENSANYEYLKRGQLHEHVCEKVSEKKSPYKHIYVNYGDRVRRVK
jgi:hypothetical protein